MARVVALVFAFTQAVFAFAPAVFGLLRDTADAGWAPVLAAALVQAAAAVTVLAGRRSWDHEPGAASYGPDSGAGHLA